MYADTRLGAQAYVAFSRVRTLDSVFLRNLHLGRIRAHPAVVAFYDEMEKKLADEAKEHADALPCV